MTTAQVLRTWVDLIEGFLAGALSPRKFASQAFAMRRFEPVRDRRSQLDNHMLRATIPFRGWADTYWEEVRDTDTTEEIGDHYLRILAVVLLEQLRAFERGDDRYMVEYPSRGKPYDPLWLIDNRLLFPVEVFINVYLVHYQILGNASREYYAMPPLKGNDGIVGYKVVALELDPATVENPAAAIPILDPSDASLVRYTHFYTAEDLVALDGLIIIE